MEARRFEQHQNTIGHKNQGRKPGQTALPDLRNIPQVELTDIAIATRLSTAWWLAKEDVAIHKFSSLVINKLISHRLSWTRDMGYCWLLCVTAFPSLVHIAILV